MSEVYIPLESIRIASPCSVSWNSMEGGDKVRFCLTCYKHVYNISEMSRSEAEALIREKEGQLQAGNLCLGLYRRADGTVLTNDCPVGLRIVQRPFKWLAAGAALLIASGIALATGHDPLAGHNGAWWQSPPIQAFFRFLPGKRVSNTFYGGAAAMTSDASPPDEQNNV